MAAGPKKKVGLPKGRHKSQIKRQRQSEKRHDRNVSVKSAIKTSIKKVKQATVEKKLELIPELLKAASRLLQKAASKGIIHSRNASRRISRLAQSVGK